TVFAPRRAAWIAAAVPPVLPPTTSTSAVNSCILLPANFDRATLLPQDKATLDCSIGILSAENHLVIEQQLSLVKLSQSFLNQ
ncbi:MAG TPA: hypothetical protein V6D18_21175, partial [Thermosynechococcaceae cyanobacterium]